MMVENFEGSDLERLKAVVGAYGAQPSRWPAQDRRDLAALAQAHADAPWMGDAVEIDKLLEHMRDEKSPDVSAGAIMAAVRATAQNRSGEIVLASPAPTTQPPVSANWPWAALLAASLLLGIWAGANGAVEILLPGTVGDALIAVNESEDESNFFGLFDQGPASTGEDVI